MKTLFETHVRFLFCILLYLSYSRNAFCSASNGDYLSHSNISPATVKTHIPIPKNRPHNKVIFNVLHYGARGDGITNDAMAFIATWNASCKTKGGVMLVPAGFTFLLHVVNFDGTNCQPNTVIKLDGNIVAPSKKLNWVKHEIQWILFSGVTKGIGILGHGVIDGFGKSWQKTSNIHSIPHAVRFLNSSNIIIRGITIQNSPLMHIYIEKCENVSIHNFTIRSPGDSRNTDGIHLSNVRHVLIRNTTIACGDDCVSIQTGSHDVKIYDVKCGPGHGYSIGGLGPNFGEAHVSDISILNSTVHNSMTGVRIKTWPGGYGSVQNIVFSNIGMFNVGTPIVIDQFYCGGHNICNFTPDMKSVLISNVTYKGITGTYSHKPVSLRCNYFQPCTNLTIDAVDLFPAKQSGRAKPYCRYHANGTHLLLTDNANPQLNAHCLDPQHPTAPPSNATPPVMTSPVIPKPSHPYPNLYYCRGPVCTRMHAPATAPSPVMLSPVRPKPSHPHPGYVFCRGPSCTRKHAPPPTAPSPLSPWPSHLHLFCRGRPGCSTIEHAHTEPSPSMQSPVSRPRLRHP